MSRKRQKDYESPLVNNGDKDVNTNDKYINNDDNNDDIDVILNSISVVVLLLR